jgi:hypothetical protein
MIFIEQQMRLYRENVIKCIINSSYIKSLNQQLKKWQNERI